VETRRPYAPARSSRADLPYTCPVDQDAPLSRPVPARPTLPTDLLPADLPYTRHLPNRPALPTLPKPAASRATYPIPTLCHHSLASRYILHGHPPPPERLTLYRSPHNSTGAARPPPRARRAEAGFGQPEHAAQARRRTSPDEPTLYRLPAKDPSEHTVLRVHLRVLSL
jgi:hypothetical protein